MAVDTAGIPLPHQFNSVSGSTHCNCQIKHCNPSNHLYRSGTISLTFNSIFFFFFSKMPIVTKNFDSLNVISKYPRNLSNISSKRNRAQYMYCFENLEMSDTSCVYLLFVEAKVDTGIKIIETRM